MTEVIDPQANEAATQGVPRQVGGPEGIEPVSPAAGFEGAPVPDGQTAEQPEAAALGPLEQRGASVAEAWLASRPGVLRAIGRASQIGVGVKSAGAYTAAARRSAGDVRGLAAASAQAHIPARRVNRSEGRVASAAEKVAKRTESRTALQEELSGRLRATQEAVASGETTPNPLGSVGLQMRLNRAVRKERKAVSKLERRQATLERRQQALQPHVERVAAHKQRIQRRTEAANRLARMRQK